MSRTKSANRLFDRSLDQYSRAAKALRRVRSGAAGGLSCSAAVAAGAALATGPAAEAVIVTSPLEGRMFSIQTNNTAATFTTNRNLISSQNFDGAGGPDLTILLRLNRSYYGAFSSSVFALGAHVEVRPSRGFDNVGSSSSIFPGKAFASSALSIPRTLRSSPGFVSTTTRIGGLQFGPASSLVGWFQARVQFQPNMVKLTFLQAAYEDVPFQPIHVGTAASQVPEPSTVGLTGLGLLALGARGILEMRRRRKARKRTASGG